MIILRFILLAFNAAIVTFLIYRLLQVYRTSHEQKFWIIFIGLLLLLVPVAMVIGFIRPTAIYILLYPVAISLYLYLIKNV
jgi:hypothetical protein